MSELKAFIGHSFTEDDTDIVRTFLDFFDHVSELGIGFSWQHAQNAEPKVVTEKVLELIDDKNLFIGICTAKETVMGAVKQSWLKKNVLICQRDECFKKTSDWIIQEIGLAIGRQMKVILLLEDGVRTPGGLQGNLEYIPFSRNSPEKSFIKILEMIKAIKPDSSSKALVLHVDKEETTSVSQIVEDGQKIEGNVEILKKHEVELLPDSTWNYEKYQDALLQAILGRDEGREKSIVASASGGTSLTAEEVVTLNADAQFFKILLGTSSSLETLEELYSSHPRLNEIGNKLARAYEIFGSFDAAGNIYKELAQKTDIIADKLRCLVAAAEQFQKSKKTVLLNEILTELKAYSSVSKESKSKVLTTYATTMLEAGDQYLYVALLEKYLEICPDDTEKRFSLAYKYSELNKYNLSYYHYTKIPHRMRSDGVWNNVGVALENLNLKFKAIQAYREAEKLGNTLAMSNIGHRLIDAGFAEEAESLCDKAVKIENYDKRIGAVITKLKENRDSEQSNLQKILDDALLLSNFFVEVGDALIGAEAIVPKSAWNGPLCTLELEVRGNKLVATGSYEGPPNPFSAEPQKSVFSVQYEGTVTGRAVKGTVKTAKIATNTSILSDNSNKTDILMVIRDQGEIVVLEQESKKIYLLTREKQATVLVS